MGQPHPRHLGRANQGPGAEKKMGEGGGKEATGTGSWASSCSPGSYVINKHSGDTFCSVRAENHTYSPIGPTRAEFTKPALAKRTFYDDGSVLYLCYSILRLLRT